MDRFDDDDIWSLLKGLKTEDDDEAPSHKLFSQNNEKNIADDDEVFGNHICEHCKSQEVILDDGNYMCTRCGTLVSRFIDSNAEWRYYGCEDTKSSDPTRCGMPANELLPFSSMGSVIGYGTNESHDIRIMRKYHMWNCTSYKERSLYTIFDNMTVNAVNHGIPKSIIEEAKVLYKKISEMKISRGENRSGLIASSIYMSCKNNKVPRSTKEIAKIFNLKVTTMTKGCKKFQDIMKINMDSTTADDFVYRFCSKLNMDKNMKDVCKTIVKKAEDLGIVSENTPPSIAAGSIYLCNVVCNWGLTKKDLSEACEISQVTISKCFKKLFTYKDHLFIASA